MMSPAATASSMVNVASVWVASKRKPFRCKKPCYKVQNPLFPSDERMVRECHFSSQPGQHYLEDCRRPRKPGCSAANAESAPAVNTLIAHAFAPSMRGNDDGSKTSCSTDSAPAHFQANW